MSVEVRNVSKAYGSFQAVQDVSLEISTGELAALLGPSGSGKTTLLRLIAGLEKTDRGNIFFKGEDATNQSARERKVGFVFQHYALFRHMNIFNNVAFGLQVRPRKNRPSKKEIRERVFELLKLVQLEGFAERKPSQLSGGQRQRVALARALAIEPEVLLLDEPFGALDAKVRQELRRWLRDLHDRLNITTVFVTHDQEEALEMADRIVVMNEGKVEQTGTPEQVYHAPANPFVCSFLGRANLFRARVPGDQAADSMEIGYIRPHEIQVSMHRYDRTSVPSVINHIYTVGPTVRLEMTRMDTGEPFEAEMGRERFQELGVRAGETVFADLGDLKLFGTKPGGNPGMNYRPVRQMQSVGADVQPANR